MKCINCGHEWDTDRVSGEIVCPHCHLKAEYIQDAYLIEKAHRYEEEGKFTEASECYLYDADKGTPGAAYAVFRTLSAARDRGGFVDATRVDFWLRAAADEGDPAACFQLSKLADKAGDVNESRHYLQKSAEGRHVRACLQMAELCLFHAIAVSKNEGEDTVSDPKAAARYYLSLAAPVSGKARFYLFLLGRRKHAEALPAFVLEGEADHFLSMADTATKESAPALAYRFLVQAGDHPEALYRRVRHDLNGKGVDRPFSERRRDLEKAAEEGEIRAWVLLGKLLHAGEVTERDDKTALEMFRKAADGGDCMACRLLGDAYLSGDMGVLNMEKALEMYRAASDRGDGEAGEIYEKTKAFLTNALSEAAHLSGAGDDVGAFAYYLDLADRGYLPACEKVGDAYLRGKGVGQSFAASARYYTRSVESGSVESIFRLGLLYARNRGVKFSYPLAVRLLSVSAKNGYPQAAEIVEELRNRRRAALAQRVYSIGCTLYHKGMRETSVRYFRSAAEAGSARAMYRLSCQAEYGEGMPKNIALSREWADKAAEAGFLGANTRMKNGFLQQRKRLMAAEDTAGQT